MQINPGRRALLAALLVSLGIEARSARVEAVDAAAVSGVPAAPLAPLSMVAPVAAAPTGLALLGAPAAAPFAAAVVPMAAAPAGALRPVPAAALRPAPASAPALSAAADAPSAREQVRRAAASLGDARVDAAGRLSRTYDASVPAPASDADPSVPAASDGPARSRPSGLSRAPKAASGAALREYKSPAGAEAKELGRVDANLASMGYPAHRTAVSGAAPVAGHPTVAILAPASAHKLAMVAEGGRQAPGDVSLVLDASWLAQEVLPDGRTRVYMKKGLTFDAAGQATLVTYRQPRPVNYFANYFTLGANDRDDGVSFERDLDVPQSSSLQLESFVNDKLLTRLMMADLGVPVPSTLALLMPEHPLVGRAGVHRGGEDTVSVLRMPAGDAALTRAVDSFLKDFPGDEVVVKPSGPAFHSAVGVKFFRVTERDAILAHVRELARHPAMTRDGSVLIDARVDSAPLYRDDRKMETTLRSLVVRTPVDTFETSAVFARTGAWGKPTNLVQADPRDNARPERWELLLEDWKKAGLLDEASARELDARVREIGPRVMAAIAEREKAFKRPAGGSYQGQTDFIGLDFMIERRGGRLVPVVIEINDHDSGSPALLDTVLYPEHRGQHSRQLVATWLARARGDAARRAGRSFRREYRSPEGSQAAELSLLSTYLADNGLPAYKTAVREAAVDDRRPTAVLLTPASRHKVAIAREGGRQSPGDVLLALDASWLVQEVAANGRARLLLKKGVEFDAAGQATVVEYRVPRVVRYFADFMTLGANDRADGVPFERGLDLPQSGSLRLEDFVNEKLWTRLEMAAAGVEVPSTFALLMPKHPLVAGMGHAGLSAGGVTARVLPRGPRPAEEVSRAVDEFLDQFDGDEVVVKPSGTQFHSARGVRFFRKDQRAEIVAHVLDLSKSPLMSPTGAVLIDSRVQSAPLTRGGRKMETSLRVLVARTPWDGARAMDVVARVGPYGKPTTGEAADPRDNAVVEGLDPLLAEWGLSPAQAAEFRRRLDALSEKAMLAVMSREGRFARAKGGPYQAQSDLLGLDVMVERRGGELVPVVIEANDHNSGGQFQLDTTVAPERLGRHSREWVATMLQRARRDALKGRTVVLVGAGYEGKRFIFERAKQLGVKIVLVDRKSPFVAALQKDGLISRLIETDNSKPGEARAKARRKLLDSVRKGGKIDGITSFWEDDVPLTADLAADLGLPYHTQAAAASVRSKARTRDVMERAGLPTPRHRRVRNLNSATGSQDRARVMEDFLAAADHVGYPAVLKPAFGAAAMGVKRVNNRAEAIAAFEEMGKVVTPETDPIFAQGTDMVLEQYLNGHEWDVDLVMKGGKAVFSSLTDNKPTREPYFLATGSILPSALLTSEQQRESIDLAIKAAQALGLNDGVVHIEGKYTSEGARLIEANGRMGGEYVRDWVKDVWGVDLVEENLMTAAGVPGDPFKPAEPLVYLDGDFVIPTKSGVIAQFGVPPEARDNPGFHELRVKKKVGDRIAVPPDGYERAGMLVARGATRADAARNLKALEAKLQLDIK